MDLDEVADELYAVPPEEFIALRTARQDEAKADGDKALAKEIGALPKPSAAAWACNLLVREQRAEIEGLVELGDLLREAQENLAGDQLQALNVQRRAAAHRADPAGVGARPRARPPGEHAPSPTQVEETLRAAMTDPDAGEALLTGRLTSPMSYSGMGTRVGRPTSGSCTRRSPSRTATPAAKAREGSAPKQTGESAADRRAREQEEARRAAEEKRQRELARAREAAEAAAAAAEEAPAAADEQRRRGRGARRRRHAELQAAGRGARRPAGRRRAGGRRRRRRPSSGRSAAAPPPSGRPTRRPRRATGRWRTSPTWPHDGLTRPCPSRRGGSTLGIQPGPSRRRGGTP